MSDINTATQTDALSAYRTQSTTSSTESSNELGQDQFLELLVAQLNNQDPLDPQENGDFIAELAQFSSVEGIDKLNTSVDSLLSDYKSSQALQASSLVGRQVVVPNSNANWSGSGSVPATVDVPAGATNVKVGVYVNGSDQLVAEIPVDNAIEGENPVSWDGTDGSGNILASGSYEFRATGVVDGSSEAMQVYGSAKVNSVTLTGGEMMLNVAGLGKIPLSEVREISE